jgi:hypothetical protein
MYMFTFSNNDDPTLSLSQREKLLKQKLENKRLDDRIDEKSLFKN